MNRDSSTVLLGTTIPDLFDVVCRQNLSAPGVYWFDMPSQCDSQALRRYMVDLYYRLSAEVQARSGCALAPYSLGRFDQQVSTKYHRDGAPDESLLMLGYEPSPVESTFSIADFSRAAARHSLSPAAFLDRFNPLFPAGETALAGEEFTLPTIRPGTSRIVLLNNSLVTDSGLSRLGFGVLHRGFIHRPDPSSTRIINSLICSTAPFLVGHDEDRLLDFATTADVSGPVYGRPA